MKKHLFLLLFMSTTMMYAQQNSAKDAFLEKWEHSKTYLLEMIEAMPTEHFDFKPTEREMSFAGQLMHIKGNMDWLSTTYFSSEEFDREKDTKPYVKEELKQLLEDAFDNTYQKVKATPEVSLNETVDFFAGPKSRLQILYLLMDHVTHHRGQLVVYMNLKGITPPKYIGW